MSTIASPRPSLSIRSPSSSRTSSTPPAPGSRQPPNARRNRTALRDYYNLKNAEAADAAAAPQNALKEEHEVSELDKEGFDAAKYVEDVLATQGLEGVLKVEAGLLSDIRNLDGERKALVYDNYSKLIAATDTIGKMRTNMDPLTPATSTLAPAIAHIAETATALSTSLSNRTTAKGLGESAVRSDGAKDAAKEKRRQTVRWVLDAPKRLRSLVKEGKNEAAEAEWDDVRRLLDKWKGVQGVDEVRARCEAVLKREGD
ncbi:hypothetical protein H2199_002050 [Coniosporium tulheliwenetii]|uniref:Uncharacterized protein n=1 Tax=Coniosporium tulheliwenetii TaxID=3383036 RepID=A0ACC2ZHK6_9PEZI|nr:hypothetical protein H2199_002050 [Cladosporium sp. JES 115]